jgi:hypothetical protein
MLDSPKSDSGDSDLAQSGDDGANEAARQVVVELAQQQDYVEIDDSHVETQAQGLEDNPDVRVKVKEESAESEFPPELAPMPVADDIDMEAVTRRTKFKMSIRNYDVPQPPYWWEGKTISERIRADMRRGSVCRQCACGWIDGNVSGFVQHYLECQMGVRVACPCDACSFVGLWTTDMKSSHLKSNEANAEHSHYIGAFEKNPEHIRLCQFTWYVSEIRRRKPRNTVFAIRYAPDEIDDESHDVVPHANGPKELPTFSSLLRDEESEGSHEEGRCRQCMLWRTSPAAETEV